MSGKTCVVCSRVPKERFLCGGCNDALYCGDACQERHWQNGHAEHCEEIGASVVVGVTKGNRISPKEAWELIISRMEPSNNSWFYSSTVARGVISDLLDIMENDDPNDTVVGAELGSLREKRKEVLTWLISNKELKPDSFNKFFPTFETRNEFMNHLFEAACSAEPRPGYDSPESIVEQLIEIFDKTLVLKKGPLKEILTNGFAAAIDSKNLNVLKLLMQKGINVNTIAITDSLSKKTDYRAIALIFLKLAADPFRENAIESKSIFECSLHYGFGDVLEVILQKYPADSVKYFEDKTISFFMSPNNEKRDKWVFEYALEHNLYKIRDADIGIAFAESNFSIMEILLQRKNFTNEQIDEAIRLNYKIATRRDNNHRLAKVLVLLFQQYIPSKQTVDIIIRHCVKNIAGFWLSDTINEVLIIKTLLKTDYVDSNDIEKLVARSVDGRYEKRYHYRKGLLESGFPYIERKDDFLLPGAAEKNDLDFMELLLNFEKVNVNELESGDTALAYLCKYNGPMKDKKIKLGEKLLQKRAKISSEMIHRLIDRKDVDFVKLLLPYCKLEDIKDLIEYSIKGNAFFLIRHFLQEPMYEVLISTKKLEQLYETFPDLRNKVKAILKARETQKEAEEEPLKEAKEPPGKMRKE